MDIMNAARYFIYLSYRGDKYSLTHLKLQKLLYLAQGWSYVWDGHAIFDEEFEAWQYGPVNKRVYDYFKKYGREEIPEEEGDVCIDDCQESKETLDAIWDNYSINSAFELVDLTHSQEPWIEAYNTNRLINNQEIERYFKSIY